MQGRSQSGYPLPLPRTLGERDAGRISMKRRAALAAYDHVDDATVVGQQVDAQLFAGEVFRDEERELFRAGLTNAEKLLGGSRGGPGFSRK